MTVGASSYGRRPFLKRLAALGVGAPATWLAACGDAPAPPAASATASGPDGTAVASAGDYAAFLTATEFVPGANRFPFVILAASGSELRGATAQVRFFTGDGPNVIPKFEAAARYREVASATPHTHADGVVHPHVDARGLYVVEAAPFDTPGTWLAEVRATTAGGAALQVNGAAFTVAAQTAAPAVRSAAPRSRHATRLDVTDLAALCTRTPPCAMHDLSVAQALAAGQPSAITFSTPAFCASRMCGPVLDVIVEVWSRHRAAVNFVHIEPWDLTLARGQGRLAPTPVTREWALPTEPWVFLVGADGRVAARFEGLVAADEIESALQPLLAQ
ncbi:MAG: hypothetical protein FJ029_08170 [Actinobacteria bacterium]|nr:hypothetical protein [Actinomycetota bacterium]